MIWVPALLIALLSWSDTKPGETFVRLSFGIWVFGLLLAAIGLALYTFGATSRKDGMLIQSLTIGPITISQELVGFPPFFRISSLAGNANALALWCGHAIVLGMYLHDTRHRKAGFRDLFSSVNGSFTPNFFTRGYGGISNVAHPVFTATLKVETTGRFIHPVVSFDHHRCPAA